MASVTISLESGQATTLVKTEQGLRFDGLEIPINIAAPLNAELNGLVQQSIQRGNTPQFARFSFIWYQAISHLMTDFTDTLTNDFGDHQEIFDRIIYELWKDGSRLQDGDAFTLTSQGVHCDTLGTTTVLQNSVEEMLNTLLEGR
jgi:hypothetical protein